MRKTKVSPIEWCYLSSIPPFSTEPWSYGKKNIPSWEPTYIPLIKIRHVLKMDFSLHPKVGCVRKPLKGASLPFQPFREALVFVSSHHLRLSEADQRRHSAESAVSGGIQNPALFGVRARFFSSFAGFYACACIHMGVSKNRGGPPKWMVKRMENPIKMDDLGGKPPIFGNIHVYCLKRTNTQALSIQETPVDAYSSISSHSSVFPSGQEGVHPPSWLAKGQGPNPLFLYMGTGPLTTIGR